jgi:hypothetical protein
MSTILNCILVEAGARKVAFTEGAYIARDSLREYQLKHTHYPEAFREWWKHSHWEAYHIFREKYGAEEDRLFEKQTREFLRKYYPSLLFTNGFIHKEPISETILTYTDGQKMGKTLGYPCWRNYGKEGGYLISLVARFKTFYPSQIYGNVSCSYKHIKAFIELAQKYYKVLKQSPLGDDLVEVIVEIGE